MRNVALIGSTGSVGRQVIEVVKSHSDQFRVVCMVADSSYALFEEQINEVKPRYAVMVNGDACGKIAAVPEGTVLASGEEAALDAASYADADVVLVAVSGFAGLKYSLRAAEAGKTIALANKETLVCGGELFANKSCDMVPVDSEHSAIWQCLNFNRKGKAKNLLLTASGGPFRDYTYEQLDLVKPEDALSHPTWNMGKKITVDCATLLNKGFEVIEAHYLYDMPYDRIKTVIQPQSIIHSMVEFEDGAILAQLSQPSMRLPIQLALTYPNRIECNVAEMDFTKAFSLNFFPLVRERFPLFDLAVACGEEGGVLPTALNGACEVAVYAFLDGKIPFTGIYKVADKVVFGTPSKTVESYAQLAEVDKIARAAAHKIIATEF